MQFKQFLLVACCALGWLCMPSLVKADAADWYLYVWSNTSNSGGDAAQFETTVDAGIFVINDLDVTEQGIGFCVHNAAWTSIYGWNVVGGSVSSTGTEVALASATQASGWLNVPVGTYQVTWNASDLTIRFDNPEEQKEEKTQFLRGGDLSMVTYMEDWGTKFKYKDGTEGDVFDILQSYGINFARLRLYNAPGTAVVKDGTTYRTPYCTTARPSGYAYAGPSDILNLALRAKT